MSNDRFYRKGKICGCGARVCDKSKSGLCRACYMERLANDPERRAKASATHRMKYATDPEYRAKRLEGARKGAITRRNDPEWRAKAARIMREVVQPRSIELGAQLDRDFSAMSKKGAEVKWAWSPPEYRATYQAIRDKGIRAPEARRITFDQIKADKERELANLSPFERQMRALERNPDALVANDIKPSLANPGIYRVEDAA